MIEQNNARIERSAEPSQKTTDVNHDILSAINTPASQIDRFPGQTDTAKTWLPDLSFDGIAKPSPENKQTIDVRVSDDDPSRKLDRDILISIQDSPKFDVQTPDPFKNITKADLDQYLKSMEFKSPDKLFKPGTKDYLLEQINIDDYLKPQQLDYKLSPQELEELFKNNPEFKKELEKLFKTEQTAVEKERTELTKWADQNLQEPARSAFKKDMAEFDERAKRDGISSKEMIETYQEIRRLGTASGEHPTTSAERKQLTQQVMHQAAFPQSIDQGQHNTCNVTSVESRMYSRTPSDAVKLVADIAITGQYRTIDGTIVRVNPKPHHESKYPASDGDRSYASEIFQVTAVNIHWARYNAQTGRNIRYEQIDPKPGDRGDNGERLMDYGTTPPSEITDPFGNPRRAPDLDDRDMIDISNQITGLNEKQVLLAADDNVCGSKQDITTVKSDAELAEKLKWMKEHGKLPALIRVDTNNEPFYSDSGQGSAGGSGGAHMLTVTDYDEKTGKVCIDNQWGSSADHGKLRAVSIHDLFTAMQDQFGAEQRLARDVQWNREHKISDPIKEMELIRMQRTNGTISDTEYKAAVEQAIKDTKNRWDWGTDEGQKQRERRELAILIHQLPPKDQVPLLSAEYKAGIITQQKYADELDVAGFKIGRLHQRDGRPGVTDLDYEDGQRELRKAIADLPQQMQRKILQNIARDLKIFA